MNLILTRRDQESLEIDFGTQKATIQVVGISSTRVRLKISADRSVIVTRGELLNKPFRKILHTENIVIADDDTIGNR